MIKNKTPYIITAALVFGWTSIAGVMASTWNSTTEGGSWSVGSNWDAGIPNAIGDTAEFNITNSGYTVSLASSSWTIGNLDINSDSGSLTVNNTGTLNFAVAAGMPTITFTTTRTTQPTMLDISSNLSGNQGLAISGNNRVLVYFRGTTSSLTGGIEINSERNYINFITSGGLNGNKVTFNATGNTLALGGGGTSTAYTWSSNIDLKTYGGTILGRSTGAQTLTGVIDGNANVIFAGVNATTATEIRLQGSNTYTGNTTIASNANRVVVTAQNNNAFGLGSGVDVDIAHSNSSLRLDGGVTISGKNLTLNGAGNNGEGSLQSSSGTNVWSGNVDTGSTANATVSVSTGRLNIGGIVSGNQDLIKSGAGTLALSHMGNTYTGATIVSAGTLLVNGNIAAGSNLTVANDAVLGGTGDIYRDVLVQAGGTFAAGEAGMGSLHIASGSLELQGDAVLSAFFNSDTLTNTSASISGDLDFDLANTVALSLQDIGSSTPMGEGTQFNLLNYTGDWNGGLLSFNNQVLANLSIFTFGTHAFQIVYDAPTLGGNALALQVVPEPSSSILLLLGSAVLIHFLSRRTMRKRKDA